MVSDGRIRLATALATLAVVLLGASASAAAETAPEVPPPTGHTARIEVVERGGSLRFEGPAIVAVGDELEIVDETDPLQIGPVTFSLVRRGYLPKTRSARDRCFTPGHICWSIAEWQGVHGDGRPTVNPAEAGLPGWDTPGATGSPGDSWYSGTRPGANFAQEVTAKAGTRLWFMDAIHPRLQGTIRVVAP